MTSSRTKKFRVIAAVLAVALASSACGSASGSSGATTAADPYDLVQPGTITAAITSDGAPFASVDKDGKPIGLLIDLNDHIAQQLGLKIVYKSTSQDAAFAGLTAGKYDMLSIGLIETPEREKNVAFTKPIYWSQNVALVRSDSTVADAEGLSGKRVGVSQKSAQAEYADAHFTGAKLVQEPDNVSGVTQLLSGNLDSMFIGSASASIIVPQHPGKLKAAFSVYLDSPSAQAMGKDKTKFLAGYDAELTKAADDGTLLKIYDKYFAASKLQFPEELYTFYPQVKEQMEKRGSAPANT
jgi:polar amino acid transport system substrate-binding protein